MSAKLGEIYAIGVEHSIPMDFYCVTAVFLSLALYLSMKLRLYRLFVNLSPFLWGCLLLSSKYGVLVDLHDGFKALIWFMLSFSGIFMFLGEVAIPCMLIRGILRERPLK